MTPTQRSLQLLRKTHGLVAIVEKWIPATPAGYKGPLKRSDLFGFADIVCADDNTVTLVQTTSGSNVSARLRKIAASGLAKLWLKSPNRRIVVHGWRKAGKAGKRKRWKCREEWM